MKILAVEDDALAALQLKEALARTGFDATVVRDGEAALHRLEAPQDASGGFAMVVANWNSPTVSGLDLCRRLRNPDSGRPDPPVYLLIPNGQPDFYRLAEDAGAAGCAETIEDMAGLLSERKNGPASGEAHQKFAIARSAEEPKEISVPKAPKAAPATKAQTLVAAPPKKSRGTKRLLGPSERLGDILVEQGVLTSTQLQEALDVQSYTEERLGTILVGKGWVTEHQIVEAYSHQVDMPFVRVEEEAVFIEALTQVSREQARSYLALPLAPLDESDENAPIRVAVADPWNIAAIDLFQTAARRRVTAVLAEATALRNAIEAAYGPSNHTYEDEELARSLEESVSDLTADSDGKGRSEHSDSQAEIGADQAPVIRLVNGIIVEAVRQQASDIHIEPYKNDFEVRYRIDGTLRTIHTLPRSSFAAVSARIKIMAELDISERRKPHDGRIAIAVDKRPIQLRVSTLPNQYGERVVLRILDSQAARRTIAELGFSERNQATFERLIRRPHGIVLVTGPTGSGKTTSLYAALNALRSPEVNIMTCEDPIEYEVERISQSNVNPRAGLTFAAQLRSILRQDPDIVLVGEIRDAETAEIAFKAAMTGHLVLSTLHCNDAASAPNRLIDMGIEPYLITSGLIGVIAQRLVRRLCPYCRKMAAPDSEQQRMLQALNNGVALQVPGIGVPEGCARCNQVGTQGRMGIHELMPMSEDLAQLVLKRTPASALAQAAIRAGMIPMAGDGLLKAIQGQVLLEDVHRKVLAS